ncbi:hypothetical protein MAR_032852 [Mya arenaria]|uniref:Uncharacterized protein n=1 Tax=Mya arenaria TaxID=6604 RepID=A0ABY7G7A3_MYAAR|nr:hypothetical protein MAR_032852 [Mya arenaria]
MHGGLPNNGEHASKIKEQLHKLELNRLATLKKIEILEKKRRKNHPDMEDKIEQLYNKVKSIDGQITDIQSLSI